MLSKFSKKEKELMFRVLISAVILILATVLKLDSKIKIFLYLASYFIVGYDIVFSCFYNIKNRKFFDENFLMTIATAGALLISEYKEAVFVMLFYQIGQIFESFAVGKSRNSIEALIDILPEQAIVLRNGEEIIVDPDEVEIGETIIIKAGEKIPIDGKVILGESSLNMALLTGESMPVNVAKGDSVYSGAVNIDGVIQVETTNEFEDSTVSKIMEMIENSADKKSKSENFITKFARVYTPIVVFSAIFLAIVPPLIFKMDFKKQIYAALSFLVVSCPCALSISVPLAFFGGIGKASKIGVLFKGSNYMEVLSNLDTIVFDKTGTLTEGRFQVVGEKSFSDSNWIKNASAIEKYSNHPIAKAVSEYKNSEEISAGEIEELSGRGIRGKISGVEVLVGNERLMQENEIAVPEDDFYGTKIFVAENKKLSGILYVADKIKAEAEEAIKNLKSEKVKNLVLLSGDRKEVADAVGKELGFDTVKSELLPQDKVKEIENIIEKQKNKTAFVGDGINDAPVLTRADVGIAMGALGSDAAIEASDIVILNDDLREIAKAIKISKKTIRISKQNIVFSIGIKVLILILAAFSKVGISAAIFADVGVMILAVLNAMRLLK